MTTSFLLASLLDSVRCQDIRRERPSLSPQQEGYTSRAFWSTSKRSAQKRGGSHLLQTARTRCRQTAYTFRKHPRYMLHQDICQIKDCQPLRVRLALPMCITTVCQARDEHPAAVQADHLFCGKLAGRRRSSLVHNCSLRVWTHISRCRLSEASNSWLRWLAQVMLSVPAAVLFPQLAILVSCSCRAGEAALACGSPADDSHAWLQMPVLAPASKAWRTKCSGITRLQQAGTCVGGRPSWSTLGAPPSPSKQLCTPTSGTCSCAEVPLQVFSVALAASAMRFALSCSAFLLRRLHGCRQTPTASPALKEPPPAPHSPSSMGGNLRGHSGSTGAPQGSSSGGVIRPQARSWRKGLSSQVGPGRLQTFCTRHMTEQEAQALINARLHIVPAMLTQALDQALAVRRDKHAAPRAVLRRAVQAHIRAWHSRLTMVRPSSRQQSCFWGRLLPGWLLGRPCWHQPSGTSTCSALKGRRGKGGQAAAQQCSPQSRQGWAQAGQPYRLNMHERQDRAKCGRATVCSASAQTQSLTSWISSAAAGCTHGGFCS